MNKEEFIRNNIKVMEIIQSKLSKKNASLFNLMVSGSHLYGFESEDSDIDYRGAFLINTNNLLGIENNKSIVQINDNNNDIVLNELKKEISLAIKGNCNALERINAKQICNTARFIELKRLINNSFGKKGLYDSYKGLAIYNYKKFILGGKRSPKKYLYVFRGLMAGIYALQNGRIEPNIEILNNYFKYKEIKDLIELKKLDKEMGLMPDRFNDGSLERIINELFERIDKAYEKSKIPSIPNDKDIKRVNSFLIKLRKENMK